MRLARLAEITKVFAEEGLGYLVERPTEGSAAADPPESAEAARRLRTTLERLGPTFVKFGQLLATRVDLFGEEVIAELGQLHSRVPPFPTEEARAIIEAELGQKIDDVFSELSAEPIASASIAQVYRGRLRTEDGQPEVAVKVQRPNLEQNLLSDLDVLVDVSGFLDSLVPQYRRSMVHRVAEEYAHRAKKEIDFVSEADAIEAFSEVLASLPELRIPVPYRRFCTGKLLVMEWLEGRKLDTVETRDELAAIGFDPTTFGRTMLRMQVSMSYEHGFVHGDTHPGNIILLPSGHIGLVDFGLHARVPRALRDKILETLFYQASGRTAEAVASFVAVLNPDASIDRAALEADLEVVLAPVERKSIREVRITDQLIDGMRVGAKHKLKAQSELFVVLRNLTIVEGIVLKFSPDLDPTEEVKEITAGILRRRLFGRGMRDEMLQLVPQVLLTISKRPQLVERLLRLERSFSDSRDLGDFLRREHVIDPPAPPPRTSAWMVFVVAMVGTLAGWWLRGVLGP